jgi:carbon starvation protein
MSSLVILLGVIVIFIIAYFTYGSWLAKEWGVDPTIKTPAHVIDDGGVDYVPAKAPILLGHHFASIAGAGPINGPIQAAIFGWVPVLLWIVIGGIFFGAVQDFSSILVSIRHKGQSLGEVIEENVSHRCKVLFSIFAWLVLLLVVAAFADIVASSFNGFAVKDGQTVLNSANGSVATASLLFIPLAVVFGYLVYRRNAPLIVSTIAGVVLLALCITVGIFVPIHLSKNVWLGFIFLYIVIASVTPVWILLQPRDYLNSFLLYFMMIAALIGIVGTNPSIEIPATAGLVVNGAPIFPFLFITVACGAISGFHSIVGSGTTSKQLDNEKDAKMIGYGGMLIECVLAVISLICISSIGFAGAKGMAPPVVFASAIKIFFINLGFGEAAATVTYTVILLAISAFALTSLDTATRLARFIFQELFTKGGKATSKNPLTNMYVSTIITVIFGGVLCLAGYQKIWPLFGACNQLVAVPAFLAVSVWLARKGRNNKMFYFPTVFMLAACLISLVMTFRLNVSILASGKGNLMVQGLQCIIIVPIFILAIFLVLEGVKVLVKINKEGPAKVGTSPAGGK